MRASVASRVRALAALTLVALAGCGSTTSGRAAGTVGVGVTVSSPPSAGAAALPGHSYPGTMCRGVDGIGAEAPARRARLEVAFVPVAAVDCTVESERVAGQGEWRVLVERRAGTGIEALVTELRRPDEPKTSGACAAFMQYDPETWFLDAAGHAVLPGWPRDSCDHLPPAVTAARTALHWTTTARVRMRQTVPQAAIEAGCEPAWKYLVADRAARGGVVPGTFSGLAGGDAPHLCRYRRAASDPLRGDFDSGRELAPAEWTALRAALDATPPVAACTVPAGRFAVLVNAGSFAEVELDGCRRVLTSDNGLRQAGPQLLALLA